VEWWQLVQGGDGIFTIVHDMALQIIKTALS